ncbi:MAG: hypothetical protein HY801_04710 [Candidatus Lindowbacteria bacterium]|nr:hypothetical protein [Candidatus Lindowbacteria bacterium]
MERHPLAHSLRRIAPHLPALLGYAVITLIFTYPLFLDPTRFLDNPIGGSNDQFLGMWDLWWLKKSLFELHASPFKTSFLYYPGGVDLSLHELTLFNGLVTLPLQCLLSKPYGIVLAFNFAVFFSFVLAGIGAYALCFHLTKDRFSSFVGGLAFAFTPYRTMHIIHIALLSTGWFPLYLLFLLRTIKDPRVLNVSAAALCILLLLYSCMSYVYFAILLTALVLVYYAVVYREEFFNKSVLLSLGLLAVPLLFFRRSRTCDFSWVYGHRLGNSGNSKNHAQKLGAVGVDSGVFFRIVTRPLTSLVKPHL